ncbi:MAG: hypothetical protein JWO56_1807, partial [Acidobacteria bacterium]|nr:hypothetical protein [Acidobacteriota bacterium]
MVPSFANHRLPLAAALALALSAVLSVAAFGAPAAFPMKLGEAGVTCFSGFQNPSGMFPPIKDDFVAGIVDVSDPKGSGVTPGTNWGAPMFHNEVSLQVGVPDPLQEWRSGNLGQVFGLTLDDASPPNLYVTATTSYGLYKDANNAYRARMFGPGGPGAVYRLDGTTGKISTFATLPNSGPGLGDIAYDRVNKQFFVTNFDDGRIYRLAGAGNLFSLTPGTVLSTFDFGQVNLGQPDVSGPMDAGYSSANSTSNLFKSGFRPLGARPWGIQVYNGRVFFAIWANDGRVGTNNANNTIWSIGVNPINGDFAPGQALLEVTLDQPLVKISGAPYSSPVSDIAFSSAGRMLLAERTMTHGDVGPDAIVSGNDGHQSRVLEFTGGSGNWGPGKVIQTGGANGGIFNTRSNSEGGVDYGYDDFNYTKGDPFDRRACDGTIWATGEQILGAATPYVYGLQGTPATGNIYDPNLPGYSPKSYAIDLNGIYTTQDKSRIGDVEIYRASCNPPECLTMTNLSVLCAGDGTGDYIIQFDFKNLTPAQIFHLFLILPAGVTATPNYINFSSNPIASGGTAHVGPIRIHGALPGSLLLTLSIHNQDLVQCCAVTVPIELPSCECAQITKAEGPFCEFNGHYGYNFTLQNLFNGPVSYVLVTPESPATATFAPNVISLNTPLQYGQSGSFLLSIGGVQAGQQVCFRISTHNKDFKECCSIRVCVKIPSCPFLPNPTNGTILTPVGPYLDLFNPNDEPGCVFPLAPSTVGADLQWAPIEASVLDPGVTIEQSLRGTVDGSAETTLVTTQALRTADGYELHSAFPALAATRHRYELFLDGRQVGVVSGVPTGDPVRCSGCGMKPMPTDIHFRLDGYEESPTLPSPGERPGTFKCKTFLGCVWGSYTFDASASITVGNAAKTFTVDEVRVFPEQAKGSRISFSALTFLARGIPHVTLTSFDDLRDCNGDGIPDDCGDVVIPPAADFTLNLNTGF